MTERKLVTVTGLLGSGKTSLASRLSKEFGFESTNIGDELARVYRAENALGDDYVVPGLECMKVHKSIRQYDPQYFGRFVCEGDYKYRVVDGLRNMNDAKQLVKAGGLVVSLVAPRAQRFKRRLDLQSAKDPSLEAMLQREMQELDDPDPDGAQTLRVMALAVEHGFLVDANQPADDVFAEVAEKLGL